MCMAISISSVQADCSQTGFVHKPLLMELHCVSMLRHQARGVLCFVCRFFVHGSTEIAALLAELADASSLGYY